MNEVIKQVAKAAAEAVIKELKEQGCLEKKRNSSSKTAFQKTEVLLYNYNNFKLAIKDKMLQIEDLKNNGLDIISKSITYSINNGELRSSAEILEEKIEMLEKSIYMTKHYVQVLEESLESIQSDPYYDIIRLKYFENLLAEDVADRLFVDVSTINRNKRRLIDLLKIRLFSDEVIYEII